jgi:hypothetical protein
VSTGCLVASFAAVSDSTIAHADASAELVLPSAVGNITLTGGPHNWNGCTSDCLANYPWNSIDWAPADGRVYASHGGIAHILDCPSDVNGHRSFVRIDYNDGSGYQVSYEHIHNVDTNIIEGQAVVRGTYLGNISTDSDCGAYATGPHTHMSLWNFPSSSSFTKANSQAVDLSGVQMGAWLVDDGSPPAQQYFGCVTPVTGGTRQCPTAIIYNDGSVGTPCTTPTASASPASPQAAGTQVAITGGATCPSANPVYKFWAQWQGYSTWQWLQGYSTTTVYNWNSTGAAAGTESFGVWARDAKSVGGNCNTYMGCYDVAAPLSYTVQVVQCTSVTIFAGPGSPRPAGTQVTFSGTASGCPHPSYEFWARWAGTSNWVLLRGYSTSNTYLWNSTGAAVGTDYFGVWARDASSSASFDANTSMPYSICAMPC